MHRALVCVLVLGFATPAAAEGAGKLDALVKRYLDGLFRAKPHLATFMGDHRFDGALPDLSAAGADRRIAELGRITPDPTNWSPRTARTSTPCARSSRSTTS